MEKSIILTIIKIIVAVLTAILGVFGVESLTSCTAYRSADSHGTTSIIVIDTTYIDHRGNYNINIK